MSRFYRAMRRAVTFLARVFFRLKIEGEANVPETGGLILCCNHTSLTDVVLLIVACGRPIFFMAKEELFRRPFGRWLFTKMGAFPVSRGNSDRTAFRHAVAIPEEGKVLGIFPEGRRYYDGAPHKAKPGAALLALQSRATLLPTAIVRYGGVRLFQRATVRFGAPIPFETYGGDGKTDKAALRALSDTITEKITALWEAGQ